MNINRNNYEEFFILYLDNELGSEERRQVEEFVAQNADLKDELEILQQTTFTPETAIVFNAKDELMRSESTSITLSNYDEWLVLSADDELTIDQRQELEQFISRHPYIQKELSLYVQAKLQPDEKIVFPDKSSLYRKEEKVRTMRWWRVAAAAVLLLLAGATYLLINRGSGKQEPVLVKTSPDNQKTVPESKAPDNKPIDKQSNAPVIANSVQPVISPLSESPDKAVAKKTNNPRKNIPSQKTQGKEDNNDKSLAIEKASSQNPTKLNTIDNNAVVGNPGMADAVSSGNKINDVTNPLLVPSNNGEKDVANTDATYALEEGGKNKKNRGLFRKAVRFFEKNTNINAADDDRLLVGGLAIKLK